MLSFVLIPFIALLINLFISNDKEIWLSRIAKGAAMIHLLSSLIFTALWATGGFKTLDIPEIVLYQSREYRFLIDLLFDGTSATYLLVGSFITFLIIRYSKYYMHLEKGYKRFFNTVLFFFGGYNFTLLSGNFETLFIGWEMLGISSFLLIAFYRERYLPVRNAIKVFSIYRIGDIGVLAAMWASHHLWHENITFFKLESGQLGHVPTDAAEGIGIFIGLALLTAAAAKSAQLPFSSWLPRAMEGPTPSSAIFYGSLSVHFGVFLLLRTYPLWHDEPVVKVVIAATGVLTSLATYTISRAQSSIKPQIAYASISQIGIMFFEVAMGWHTLVLIHFTGNAFLRTYQLLISPSVVNYLIRDQQYHFVPESYQQTSKWANTLYLLSVNEWHLDEFMNKIFNFIKKGGRWLMFIDIRNVLFVFTPLYIAGLLLYLNPSSTPKFLQAYLPFLSALLGLLLTLRSFAERKHPRLAWVLIIFNHLSLALAVSFNEEFSYQETIIYLSGIGISGVVGYIGLAIMRAKENHALNMYEYQGLMDKYPLAALIIFLATLGLMGFPITPAFIGEDLLFSHIHEDQYGLAFIIAASFVISGISLIRIYARIFLGTTLSPRQSNPIKTS